MSSGAVSLPGSNCSLTHVPESTCLWKMGSREGGDEKGVEASREICGLGLFWSGVPGISYP